MTALADCPRCRVSIPLEDVSVPTDIALCRRCGERWEYSTLLERQEAGDLEGLAPPSGAWHVSGMDGFEVGTSTRSPVAFFMVPFMAVWSWVSLSGIYGKQIATGKFELFPSLFGIPFVLGTLIFGSLALMAVCGKVVVRVRGGSGTVFSGVGPLGRTRRFDWTKVSSIGETWNYSRRGQGAAQITITADRVVKLYALTADRQRYVLAVLNHHRHR